MLDFRLRFGVYEQKVEACPTIERDDKSRYSGLKNDRNIYVLPLGFYDSFLLINNDLADGIMYTKKTIIGMKSKI
jgi:hypothetical protein